jgi:hypothetical protein
MSTPFRLTSTFGGRVGFGDERTDRHDPGVVHQHLERPELALDRIQERLEARGIGDVERQAERPGAERGGGRGGELRVDVADRDPCSLPDQRGGGGAADAPTSSGDRDHRAGERTRSLGHVSSLRRKTNRMCWYLSVPPVAPRYRADHGDIPV